MFDAPDPATEPMAQDYTILITVSCCVGFVIILICFIVIWTSGPTHEEHRAYMIRTKPIDEVSISNGKFVKRG